MAYKKLRDVDSVSTFDSLLAINESKVVQITDDDFNEHYGIKDMTGNLYSVDKQKADGIVQSAEGEIIAVNDSSDDYIRGLHIYGKSTQDGTPTMTAPVDIVTIGKYGNVEIIIYGKNLCPSISADLTTLGVKFSKNDNGSVSANGTATDVAVIDTQLFTLNKGIYALSGSPDGGGNSTYEVRLLKNGSTVPLVTNVGGSSEVEITEKGSYKIRMVIRKNYTASNIIFYPMLRSILCVDNSYKPHVEAQTLSISTVNGLPGLPVESDGNYTDKDGQQWVSDEIDLERGVYIQRIATIELNGTETWLKSTDDDNVYMYHTILANAPGNTSSLCDKLVDATGSSPLMVEGQTSDIVGYFVSKRYSVVYVNLGYYMTVNTPEEVQAVLAANPITVYYPLATPIETPLSDADILNYRALRTNYLGTTITNDIGVHTKLEYNTDTKTYIDNKFEELKALITA